MVIANQRLTLLEIPSLTLPGNVTGRHTLMSDSDVVGVAGVSRGGKSGSSIEIDEAGALLSLSPQAEALLGIRTVDFIRKPLAAILQEEGPRTKEDLRVDDLAACCKQGRLLVCRQPDGSARWVRCDEPAPQSGAAVYQVSLLDATEEALERDSALMGEAFGNLLDAVPGGAIVVNEQGMMVVVNEEAARIFGSSSRAMRGGSIATLIPTRLRTKHAQHVAGFMGHHLKGIMGKGRGRLFGLRADGSEFEIEVDLSQISRGERAFVMCVVRDAEESRRYRAIEDSAETAQKASEAKTLFLTRMSHELRTPLNAVLGFSQLLEMDGGRNLTLEQQGYVRQIMKAGKHLLEMISDVMDISRIEAGAVVLSMEAVDIGDAIAEAVSMASTAAGTTSVKVSFDMHSRQMFAKADKLRLRQVLVNLVSNGIKYNREGGSVLVRSTAAGRRVAIEVTDTGIGLSREKLEHLYEPFNRLGAENTPVEGSGMGLVITRSLVEKMGGELVVESSEGVGSTFRVYLERTVASIKTHQDGQRHEWSLSRFGMDTGRLRAVYVEDNEANRELLRSVMATRPNWELTCVKTADEAIDELRRERPDLLIVDMHLPDMHGVELVMRLEKEPATASIPRVGLSADSMESSRMYAMSAGFARYFTKPLDIKSFMEFIDKVADGSSGWSLAH